MYLSTFQIIEIHRGLGRPVAKGTLGGRPPLEVECPPLKIRKKKRKVFKKEKKEEEKENKGRKKREQLL